VSSSKKNIASFLAEDDGMMPKKHALVGSRYSRRNVVKQNRSVLSINFELQPVAGHSKVASTTRQTDDGSRVIQLQLGNVMLVL
jgi:hypothetical protein